MKQSGQVVIAFLLLMGLMVYITVSGHMEQEQQAKWQKSLKNTKIAMDLNCSILSMNRNSFWYRCSSVEGVEFPDVSFVQIASLVEDSIAPESKLVLKNVKIDFHYSKEFKCVINPFYSRTKITNLIQELNDLCLEDSEKILSKIKT